MELYEKPVYYAAFADREISKAELQQEKNKITYICCYKIQTYVKRHYGLLPEVTQQDMIQETAINMIKAIDNFIEVDINCEFWAYVNKYIEWELYEVYRKNKECMTTSPYVQKRAKALLELIEMEHLSLEEAAKKIGCKKSTAQNYLNLSGYKSLDEIDEYGRSLINKLSSDSISKSNSKSHIDEVISRLNREGKFIIKTFLSNRLKKSWKRDTLAICRQRGISDKKSMEIINQFKKDCNNVLVG